MKNRITSIFLCACLLLGVLLVTPQNTVAAAGISEAGGWNETIYAKLTGVTDSQITGVSYSGTTSGALQGQDLQYLVRDENGAARIDIPGIPAGTYTLTVTTKSGTLKYTNITVPAQDRSGYAHYGTTEGVGAYNNDGTLKKNAVVLYVTDANKNTVSVTSKDGTTVTGIGNILNSVGQDCGNGTNSKGGLANTNQDIIRKLAKDGTPLVVRFIGTVGVPEGLTAYNSVDYGGTKGDNGFMARMSGGKNVTIEGIGTGATLDGWGLHFICQTADYAAGLGRSFEVRNLSFKNVPEDCVGMEGQQEESTLTAPVERCWIHHCAFYAPTISNPAESDKDGGDGACDFKRGQYFTNSYCYYSGYHKTNLVGSSDSSLQYNITYHHNYWKDCESRGPLARQANIHMYNNVFEGQTSYCMNPRANAYIFSEYNFFYKCKNPVEVDSGAVKSYQDVFSCCTKSNDATIVTDRNQKVSTSNKYANFDTNASLSYIPSGDYLLQTDITQMKATVLANAGPMGETIRSESDINTSEIPSSYYPTAAVKLPYQKSLNSSYITAKSGTYDNVGFHVTKLASDSLTLGGATGCDIVFYVDQPVNITLSAVSGEYVPVLCNAAGVNLITGSGTATNLPAGYYFIQSSGFDTGTQKFKEAKITGLSIAAYDPNAAVQPIPPAPTPDDSGNGGTTGGEGGNGTGGNVTVPTTGYIHNFTENGKNSDFYSITGNLSTGKGTVTYNGLSLTQCLKMESSTNISFTAPKDGRLLLVFGGSTSASGKKVKIDGEKQEIGADGTLLVELKAGNHSITKGDSINLFYMIFSAEEEHVHSYISAVTTEPGCTGSGIRTYSCTCGHSYTEIISALGHSDKNGDHLCDRCGADIGIATEPDQPINPDDPTVPENPDTPDVPDEPTSPAPTAPTVPENPDVTEPDPTVPETGEPTQEPTQPNAGGEQPADDDSHPIWLWLAGLALLLAVAALIVYKQKKE